MNAAQATRKQGFTIIEVVLAMGVLMVGMSVILTLLTFGAGLSRESELRADSAAAVSAVVADLRESFFPLSPEGVVGEPTPITDRPLPGYPGLTYSASAIVNPDRVGDLALMESPGAALRAGAIEYRVDITMSWRSGGARQTRQFSALLPREVPFGARMRRLFVDSEIE
jgi:type II secretory pathway pseudopilin PulG